MSTPKGNRMQDPESNRSSQDQERQGGAGQQSTSGDLRSDRQQVRSEDDEIEEEPVLDEEDLEENDLAEEDLDDVEWEAGREEDEDLSSDREKDLTV